MAREHTEPDGCKQTIRLVSPVQTINNHLIPAFGERAACTLPAMAR